MSLINNIRNWFLEPLLGAEWVKDLNLLSTRRDYRRGIHKAPIKSADDAIIVNFIGLQVDRSVANLFGKEPKFDLPGESDSAEQKYIDTVWQVNRKMNLLKQSATYGAEAGTGYMKILPDGAVTKDNQLIPRLVALDPAVVTMDALPEDIEMVNLYTIAYMLNSSDPNSTKAIQQIIEHDPKTDFWNIIDSESINGARWTVVKKSVWEHNFAPIVHWQNLSEPGSTYGRPDITADLIDLQDKINFVSSNTAKIIKWHASPHTWGRGFGSATKIQWGVDDMLMSTDPNAIAANLEMQSDLSSSLSFIRYLRQSMFDIARSVDIDSLADKLGSLTNFGLRVLYQDALSKLEEKRGLYGEGIVEINHRLLELAGAANTDGGEVLWPDLLPANDVEVSAAIANDLNLGLVSKQTASEARGYTWEDEEKRMATEKQAGDNLGAALLRTFGQGG